MNWYKKASTNQPEITKEMKDFYNSRTNKHISLVQKYCKKINDHYGDRFSGIIERGEIHDQSKLKDPELTPYIYITWDYKCKDDKKDFPLPEKTRDEMNQATEHHVSHNKHHPEYHSDQKKNTINRENRDKPPEKMIDATKMKDLDIAEMCADWAAMSDERGNSPTEWADKNVNKRWKFNEEQTDLIYDILNNIWEK